VSPCTNSLLFSFYLCLYQTRFVFATFRNCFEATSICRQVSYLPPFSKCLSFLSLQQNYPKLKGPSRRAASSPPQATVPCESVVKLCRNCLFFSSVTSRPRYCRTLSRNNEPLKRRILEKQVFEVIAGFSPRSDSPGSISPKEQAWAGFPVFPFLHVYRNVCS